MVFTRVFYNVILWLPIKIFDIKITMAPNSCSISYITNCEIFKLLSVCWVSAYRNWKVELNILFVSKDWVHSQSSCRVNRRQRLMRDDFKNKFLNNHRVFSLNHLYIRFFARYFYPRRGERGTGKLPRDFRGREGSILFGKQWTPWLLLLLFLLFYLFFAYTLCRVPIKNSTAATVIGLVKRVYVQSDLKNCR